MRRYSPDSGGFCWKYVPTPCDVDAAAPLSYEQCKMYCGADSGTAFCSFRNIEGHSTIKCTSCAVGRRPEGYVLASGATTSSLGDYFAVVAELEAASIDAFLILRDDLIQHGAPKNLVAGAERAARDEVRHARMTARVAKRNGATPKAPSATPRRSERSLEEIAIENAIEGCVRETYGAVTAMWQAERAEDPSVRALMKRIAVDETPARCARVVGHPVDEGSIERRRLREGRPSHALGRARAVEGGRVGRARADAVGRLTHGRRSSKAPRRHARRGLVVRLGLDPRRSSDWMNE